MTGRKCVRLAGYANPAGAKPGFVVPVFADGDALVVQDGRVDGTVTGFLAYDGGAAAVARDDALGGPELRVGDATWVGFQFADGSVAVGPSAELERSLAGRLSDLAAHPFVRLEVAAFLGDEGRYRDAVGAAAEVLAELDAGRAGQWARDHLRLERLLPVAVHDLAARLGADIVTAFVYDEADAQFHLPTGWGLRDPETFEDRWMLPRTGRVAGQLVRERQPILADRVPGHAPMDGPFARRERVASAAGFPLLDGPRAVGVLFVSYRTHHSFGADERARIQAGADHLAGLVRGHAHTAEPGRAAASVRPGTDPTLQAVLDLASDAMNLPVAIWSRPVESDRMVPVAGFGLTSRYWRAARDAGAGGGYFTRLLGGEGSATLSDLGDNPDFPFREAARAAGWATAVALPIRVHGTTCGVVEGLSFDPQVRPADHATLRRLAAMAGEIIANGRRNREAETIEEVGRVVQGQPDLDKAMRAIVAGAIRLTGAVAGGVCSRGVCHVSVTAPGARPLADETGRARLDVPLRTRDELVTLFVEGRRDQFSAHDTRLLRRLAEQVSGVLDGPRMLLNASTEIERATARVYSQEEEFNAVLDRIVGFGEPAFQLAAVQFINDRERTIETVAADGAAKRWEWLARHSLDEDPALRDIQADIALARPLRVEILARFDPRFDPWIYQRFQQQNLVRVFVPLVLARDAGGKVLTGADLDEWLATWQIGEWSDDERDNGRRQFAHLDLPDRLPDGRPVTWDLIGTVEAGYLIGQPHTITRDQAFGLAKLAAGAADSLRRCQLTHVFETVADQAIRIVGGRYAILHCGLTEKDDEVVRFEYEVHSGPGAKALADQFPPRRDGIGVRAISARTPVTIPDFGADDRDLARVNPKLYAAGVRSVAAVPLLPAARQGGDAAAGSGVLYVIGFGNESGRDDDKIRRLTTEELGWLRLFAGSAADAIRHVIAYTRVQERSRLLASLHAMADSLVGNPLDPEMLWHIAHNTLNILGADIVTIYEYLSGTETFVTPPHIAGRLKDAGRMETGIGPQDTPALLVRRPVPVYAERSSSDRILNPERHRPAEKGRPFIEREGVTSSVGLRLVAGGPPADVVGVMFINYRRPHEFHDDERRLIEVLASVAAMAIQNSRLMHGFREIDKALLTAQGSDEVLARIAERARLVTRAEVGEIMLVNPVTGDLEPRARSGNAGADGPDAVSPGVRSAFARRVARGNPVMVPDFRTHPDRGGVETGHGCALGVPLTDAAGRVLGVLTVFHPHPHALDTRGQTRLEALAVPAVVALHNDEGRKQLRVRRDISILGWVASKLLHRLNGDVGLLRKWAGELADPSLRRSPDRFAAVADQKARKIFRLADEILNRIEGVEKWAKGDGRGRQPVDLVAVAAKALADGLPANVMYDWRPVGGLPPVAGDEGLFYDIVHNVLQNAAEAMPEGGTLTVTAVAREAQNRLLVDLRVADTGAGVPDELLPLLRLGQPVSSRHGMGLGLYLAGTYVRHLGGQFDVRRRSDLPNGTEVVIILPAWEDEDRVSVGAAAV